MKNFISNSERSKLKDRIIELVAKSKELKFLVGFFYFSGIRELYESLKNKDGVALKVLVGLNADTLTVGLTEYVADEAHLSDEESTKEYKGVQRCQAQKSTWHLHFFTLAPSLEVYKKQRSDYQS